MAKRIPIDIDLNAREAQRSAKELNRELQATEDALGEVESAGKTMARVIQQQADDMIAEIDATRRAVDALERSLGPDFTADPTAVVADLKKVGLTAQEIESDADELAAALKRIDDVKIHAKDAGFDELDQAVSNVEGTSRVASTAIGGIGNSISELPGIGGTLGPVAESMGMLAENALEGEANLKQLVVAGGGLAALGLTMGVISKAMASAAETKAFRAEQVEGFRDALREIEPGMSAVVESLRDAEGITGRAGGIGSFFEDTKDITSDLREAGVTYNEWVKAIEDGGAAHEHVTDKLRKHREAIVEDRNEAQRNGDVTVDLERKIASIDDAIEIAGETRKDYSKAVEANTAWEKWHGEAVEENAAKVSDAGEMYRENAEGIRSESQRTADKLTADWDRITGKITDEQAFREVEASFAEVRDAGVKAWTEGGDAVDDYRGKQLDAQLAVANYIKEVGGIPPEKATAILALIDQGKFDEAQTALNVLTAPLSVRIKPYLDMSAMAGTQFRGVGTSGYPTGPGRAAGGPVSPGMMYPVGEGGRPELFEQNGVQYLIPGDRGQVTPASSGPAAGGGLTVHIHAGIMPDKIQLGRLLKDAQAAYERAGGR